MDCSHNNVDWEFDTVTLGLIVRLREWWRLWPYLFKHGDCQTDEISLEMKCQDCGTLIKQRYRKIDD